MRNQSPLFSSGSKTANFITPSRLKQSPLRSTTGTMNRSIPQKNLFFNSGIISSSPQPFDTQRHTITSNYFNQNINNNSHRRLESPLKILLKTGYDYQEEIKKLKRENQDLHSLVKQQREKIQDTQINTKLIEENEMLREIIRKLQKENDELKQNIQN